MNPQICLIPKLNGLGGMVSFQAKFIQGLQNHHIPYTFNINDPKNSAILVIGGTRHLWQLWRAKRHNLQIVQRLNGLNWLHQVEKTPVLTTYKAVRNNQTLAFIRRFLASHIIYQSEFSRDWWHREFRDIHNPVNVVYNGVDLEKYSPKGSENPPQDHYRLLLVEGHLTGVNRRGLITAVKLTQALKEKLDLPLELVIVGDVDDDLKAQAYITAAETWINWRGIVPPEMIPSIDRSAHVFFSADLNAACPNSVIEALACGLPIVAYDTGSLKELVQNGAGEVVPYGSNYWQLEEPVIPPLADACIKILKNNNLYRQAARKRAEAAFGLQPMVDSYLKVLVG